MRTHDAATGAMSIVSLLVVKSSGLVTIQDLGRRGRMHEALSPGGALVPSLLARVNRAVGNPGGAAAIEISGSLVVRAERDVRIATIDARHDVARREIDARHDVVRREIDPSREPDASLARHGRTSVRELRAGDEVSIASAPHRVTYLAIHGGVDAPVVLGGRGAQLSAGIGARIRAGERLAIAPVNARHDDARHDDARQDDARHPDARHDDARYDEIDSHERASETAETAVRVIAGPDLDAFASDALDVLVGTTWRISSSSNRVGTRLEGIPIARRVEYVEQSRPMVIGAIEVPRDGTPIVLGPEHPTTGGYPILAVIAFDDLDVFHAIPLGGRVRFRR